MRTTIAHLSDTHFDGTPRTAQRNRVVLDYLRDLPPSALAGVVVSGDVTDHGDESEYAQARAELTGPWPMLVIPGNHDRRDAFAAGLYGQGRVGEPLDSSVDIGPVVLIGCDSSIPAPPGSRIDEGRLDAGTLHWLDSALAARRPDQWALICLHHPPAPVQIPLMDPIRLSNGAELLDVLRRHAGIAGILTGHAHTAGATELGGIPVRIAPGVASAVPLPFEPNAPITPALPPGFAFHIIDDEGRLTTHFRILPTATASQ